MIAGASAIVDRRDVIPAGIEAAGGEVLHFGMPVDPGNLVLLGRLNEVPLWGYRGVPVRLRSMVLITYFGDFAQVFRLTRMF